MELGDLVEQSLARFGVTVDRVERWLGKCRCRERRDKLNALSAWARHALKGDPGAGDYLKRIFDG